MGASSRLGSIVAEAASLIAVAVLAIAAAVLSEISVVCVLTIGTGES